jgi:acetyl esterase/lipase
MRYVISMLFFLLAPTTQVLAEVQASRDVAYGAHPQQRYDVYHVQGRTDRPLIVMLHGGGWATGSKDNAGVWKAKVGHFVPEGYVFASVETRLLGDGANPLTQANDLAKAVAHLRANASRYGADSNRVILMGHSAGAHVAALVAADTDLRRVTGPLAGVVVLDTGALDLEALMANDPSRIFRKAFGTDPQFWQTASPKAQVSKGAPQFLAICRTRSAHVCAHARAFASTAASKGVRVEVRPTSMNHRQINTQLGRDQRYTTLVSDWISDALR